MARKPHPGNFLDIGCSEGFYVQAAKSLGWDAFGVEVAGKRVEHAKSRGLNIFSFEEYSEKLDFFDFVLVRHVIEHVPEFLEVIKSALRQTKDGGVVCIETPNQKGLITLTKRHKLLGDRFLGHLYPPTHIHAFEPKTYLKIAKKLNVKSLLVTTYSPADSEWFFISNYHESYYKKFIHKLITYFGMGENICAIYLKNNEKT